MTNATAQLPNNYIVPPGSEGIQLPASGGSIINFGTETVYVCPTQESVGNTDAAAPLVPGTSLPWPENITCYGFVAGGESGSVYITPITSTAYPVPQLVYVGVGPQAANYANQATNGSGSQVPNFTLMSSVPGNGIVISSAILSAATAPAGGHLVLFANGDDLCAINDLQLVDHFDAGPRGLYVPPGSLINVSSVGASGVSWTSYFRAAITYDQL